MASSRKPTLTPSVNGISGDVGNDTIYGGDGNDVIDGGSGKNRLFGDTLQLFDTGAANAEWDVAETNRNLDGTAHGD